MDRSFPSILRFPLLALGCADLAMLAVRLRPWNAIASLPGQGTAGFDPVICLVTYIVLMFWISGNPNPSVRKALSIGTFLGVLAGVFLAAHLLLRPGPGNASLALHLALLVGAGVLWAAAGFRSARHADQFAMGIVGGVWSAMVSALMACAALLATFHLSAAPQDPNTWIEYQSLTMGTPSLQSLIHALVTVTGFLLICPLAGGVLGLVCGLGQEGEALIFSSAVSAPELRQRHSNSGAKT